MRTKAAFLCAALLGLAACFPASPDKKYFQIHLDPAPPASASLGKTILLDRIDINSLYDDFRMIYRVSPYEVNYYTYEFWAEKPSRLARAAILRYLAESRLFAAVLPEPSSQEPDWVLKCAIYQIEEVDEPGAWFARLAMRLQIEESKSGAVIAARRFDRREPLSKKDVAEVPAVISRILSEELSALFAEAKGR